MNNSCFFLVDDNEIDSTMDTFSLFLKNHKTQQFTPSVFNDFELESALVEQIDPTKNRFSEINKKTILVVDVHALIQVNTDTMTHKDVFDNCRRITSILEETDNNYVEVIFVMDKKYLYNVMQQNIGQFVYSQYFKFKNFV